MAGSQAGRSRDNVAPETTGASAAVAPPMPEPGAKRTAEPTNEPAPMAMSRSRVPAPWVKNWLPRPASQVPSPTVMLPWASRKWWSLTRQSLPKAMARA